MQNYIIHIVTPEARDWRSDTMAAYVFGSARAGNAYDSAITRRDLARSCVVDEQVDTLIYTSHNYTFEVIPISSQFRVWFV